VNLLRYLTLGIRPEYQHLGLGNAFYLRTWVTGIRKGYYAAEASWVLEDNLPMVRPLEKMGAPIYKTWRLYERSL